MKYTRFVALAILAPLFVVAATAAGCGSVTEQTKITIWGEGTQGRTPAAAAADNAIAAVTVSDKIETPATSAPGVLTVGSDAAFPPLEFLAVVITNKDGKEEKTVQLAGFEWDLCLAVAKKMGLQATALRTSWLDLPEALTEREVDIVASAMSTTAARLEKFSATEPYLPADLAICTSVDRPMEGPADLNGKIVGVQMGTPAESVLDDLGTIAEVRTYTQVLRAFEDLANGSLDAVVTEEFTGTWILENDPDYKDKYAVSGRIETGEGYAFWCVRDRQDLLAAMNTALEELRAEGVYQKILKKWGLSAE